jgi:hypothetical protein
MADRAIAVIAALLVLCPAARAQLTGSIEGMVTDPAGRVVSGAQVRVVERATNAERRLDTDHEGRYVAAELAPGSYRVEVAKAGFQARMEAGLVLTAGRTLRSDVALVLGTTRESVTVTAEAPQIDAAPGAWGGSVEAGQISSLPLNGRDIFDLASQQPGATAPASATRAINTGGGVHISINGSRPSENAFRLDGIYVNDATGSAPASASGSLLGVEAIAELRLVTSPFSAEFGRSAGGVVTAVSKSGTNEFHGSVYEYLRNSAFDARNYFDPASEKIPAFRRNQFGGLVGGPAWKDRLFFLVNYEGLRLASSSTQVIETPDAQARRGLIPVKGVLQQVPVSPAIGPYLALYPLPNGRNLGDGTGEYLLGVPTVTNEDYATGRLDFAFTPRLRFGARYTFDQADSRSEDAFRVWTFASDSHSRLAQASAQYVQSASVIHDIRAAFSQIFNGQSAAVAARVSPELSFVAGQPIGPVGVVGLSDFGGQNARANPRQLSPDDVQLSYGLTRATGAHKFSAGASFDRVRFDQTGDQDRSGYYTFSSLASFLAASPRSVNLMTPLSGTLRQWRFNQFAAFVQDDFRVVRRLSVGIGVRYETATTPGERDGKVATLPDPLHDTAVTVGGPLFVNPARWNFAPRASLAWDVFGNGGTVLRAGAGIFYALLGTRELVVAGFRMPPFYNRATISKPSFPNALAALQNNTTAMSVDGLAYRPNQPYTAQFQILVEKAVGRRGAAQLGYSGSRGVHLVGHIANLNTSQPQRLANGQVWFPSTSPAINPNFGQIAMRVTDFDSNYHSLIAGARVRVTGGLHVQGKFAWSKSIDDNSIVTLSDFYTAEKVPTVFNYRQNRGRSDFDCPLTFAMNFTYNLPRPVSRAGSLLGGWALSGLAQAQSGNPFNPTVGFDNAHLLGSSTDLGQRPNLIPGQPLITGDPQQYYNPLAFSLPPAGYLGNLGRNVLLGPGLVFASLALERSFLRSDARALRIRGEVFNVANHPNFQLPSGTSLFDSTRARLGTAGQITATTTSSRQVQLSARLTF